MGTIRVPAKYLVPEAIDWNAATEPERVLVEYPRSPMSYGEGFVKITNRDFSNAINGVAHWLEKEMGYPGQKFETVAYIGPNDPRYLMFIPGAIKAGYKALFLSPRNSIPAQKSLMEKTACKVLVTTESMPAAVEAIVEALPDLKILELPALDVLLYQQNPDYPYAKTWAEASNEPVVVIHTSGSTGIPKPIIITHRFACALVNAYTLNPPEGQWMLNKLWTQARIHLLLPLFHAAGVINFLNTTYLGNTIIMAAAATIPTARGLIEAARQTNLGVVELSPATLLELANEPAMIQELIERGHEHFFYAGGDLPREIGDKISQSFKLWTLMGSSEIGVWPQVRDLGEWDRENWKYVAPRPDSGIEFIQRSDELYEQVVVRKKGLEFAQAVFELFPDLQQYHVNDLYAKHPTKPGLWTFSGRTDDIIVLLNGEKTNPTSFENTVSTHPDVSGALVAGAQRCELCLLVEMRGNPEMSTRQRSIALEKIWPLIAQANEECPRHARISKSLVFFTTPEKPMARAGKGTIQRALTIAAYVDEIQTLYRDADKISEQVEMQQIEITDPKILTAGIKQQVQNITQWNDMTPDDDFFQRGMDSLQVLLLSRNLRATTGCDVTPSLVYSNASAARLAYATMEIVANKQDQNSARSGDTAQAVNSTTDLFKKELDLLLGANHVEKVGNQVNGSATRKTLGGKVVAVTGTTGGLGAHILDTLLKDPRVSHVYCLNRSKDSESVQREKSVRSGLSTKLFTPEKVTFLTAALDLEHLGLSAQHYDELSSSVTSIIHNAWPVNFNIPLDAFHKPLKGLVNLIGLAAKSHRRASIFYISSIGSVMGYAAKLPSGATVPEEVINDPLAALDMAYGQSKLIGEWLIDYASQKYGVHGSSVRVGQIAGPVFTDGVWAKQEWVPSLVISSRYLGALPENIVDVPVRGEDPQCVDWVPVDILGKVIVDLVVGGAAGSEPNGSGATVFHPLNPSPVTWSSLVPGIISELDALAPLNGSARQTIKKVSLNDWLTLLRQSGKALEGQDASVESLLKLNPALKLLGFFEGLAAGGSESEVSTGAKLSITQAKLRSETLRELNGVSQAWMKKWVERWFRG